MADSDYKYPIQLIIQKVFMEKGKEPDPRFKEFEEVLDSKDKVIGFKITGNEFLFQYDQDGGWEDQKGNYYNRSGILVSEGADSQEDDSEDLNDELVDRFEQILLEEEEGVIKNQSKKQKPSEKEKEQAFNFKQLVQKVAKKQGLRENLPEELFIYFKMKPKFFEEVPNLVEAIQSIEDKNKMIEEEKKKLGQFQKKIISNNQWITKYKAICNFSGDSIEENIYDRYWFGLIKATAVDYMNILNQINDSNEFYLLEEKTYYSLFSKFYSSKKKQDKIKILMKQLTEKINKISENEVISIRIDNIQESFPLSLIYDFVDYVGGFAEDLQQVKVVNEYEANVFCLKRTALKLINIEYYCYGKKQHIEIDVGEVKPKKQKYQFYNVQLDNNYKINQRQLHDAMLLTSSRAQVAKKYTYEESNQKKARFALGSQQALKRVLMYRGDTMNIISVSVM